MFGFKSKSNLDKQFRTWETLLQVSRGSRCGMFVLALAQYLGFRLNEQ
jgi:hypothetical protein